jgi:hypothetical protein
MAGRTLALSFADDAEKADQGDGFDMNYFDYVASVAEGPQPSEVILNRSADHAAIILERLFLVAKDRVRILCHALSGDVYGTERVRAAVIKYLSQRPEGILQILVETQDAMSDNLFIEAMLGAKLIDRITISVVPSTVLSRYKFNFAIVDGASYRFEDDRSERRAVVKFGDVGFGSTLDRVFESIAADSDGSPPVAA